MINIVKLRKLMQMRIRGSGSDWDYIFYASINDVISDLIVETVLDVDPIDEDDIPAEIDLDAKHFNTFVTGIHYYMQKNAAWARTSEEVSDADYRRALSVSQAQAIEDDDMPTGLDYEEEDE